MKTIVLTKGHYALVDDADFDELAKHQWCATETEPGRWYAKRRESGRAKYRYMHREIIQAPAGVLVDHRNGDGLDNRRANLRLCSGAENCRNKRMRKNNKSGFKGVYWHKKANKWAAVIGHGKRWHLGLFADSAQAALAYDAKAREFFGEFALVNFPNRI